VTVTYKLWNLWPLLYGVRVPILVLIAQVVFLLERGHTDRQTNRQTD